MTVLEKIKRCVSLVWDFQEFYGEEDIEDFCRNELHTYPQHNEIMEYFKHLADLEKENAEQKTKLTALENANRAMVKELNDTTSGGLCVLENVVRSKEQLTKAKDHIKKLLGCLQQDTNDPQTNYYVIKYMTEAEQFLSEVEK